MTALFEPEQPRPFQIEFLAHRAHPEWVARSLASAANRWERFIVGDHQDATLPEWLRCAGQPIRGRTTIDDLLIVVDAPEARIEGGGAGGGPCLVGPSGQAAVGMIRVARLGPEEDHLFRTIAAHEIGHVLGIGTLFEMSGLVESGGSRQFFVGPSAMKAYGTLMGLGPVRVPLEDDGGDGVAGAHWEADDIPEEIMSQTRGAISAISLGALEDLGYEVDWTQAEGYVLGNR